VERGTALDPYAVKVEPVPTVNFVSRWIKAVTESHRYDQDLRSIELVTSDGYEPLLRCRWYSTLITNGLPAWSSVLEMLSA
jgi:hypothetical protein